MHGKLGKCQIAKKFERVNLHKCTFIAVSDYFDESLVIFRRKMCWTIDSILYHTFNNASYEYKSSSNDDEFR